MTEERKITMKYFLYTKNIESKKCLEVSGYLRPKKEKIYGLSELDSSRLNKNEKSKMIFFLY